MTYTQGVRETFKRRTSRTVRWLKKRPHRLYLYYRLYKLRWKKLDRKYGWKWRGANLFAAVLMLSGVVIPIAQEFWQSDRYTLSAEASQLVGKTDTSLTKQLTYDPQNGRYQFNKDAIATGGKEGMPAALQQASVGATGKSNTKSYSLDVPEDFSKGVTYHDTNSQLSFSLVPQFDAMQGKVVNGHIVFPMGGNTQAIYTLKNNGLKEDIVVPKATQDTMRFSYDLQLPKTLVAKALPDHSGGIGIYSADPALFSNISYGSDKDRQAVEKTRETADKDYLVFGLPAPVVVGSDTAAAGQATARFELSDNTLTVVAEHLDTTKGAVSIDPSVVVTSSSDFQTGGNNEGMIDFGTSGQITRGSITGGTMGSWSTTTAYSSDAGLGSAAYNGYLYVSGGLGGNTGVSYAALNSNGTLGSWTSATAMGTSRGYHRMEAYNGYLYAIGGTNGSSYYNTVEYAPIASNGTIGTWQSASSFTTGRSGLTSAVYNGYLYIMGGYDGSSVKNDVQYTPIKADGSLGSWASATSFTTARTTLGGFAYNGYLYIMGGYDGGSTFYSDTQYAKLNSDGTVGMWTATTSFTTGRAAPQVTVYNGYVYVMGGTSNTTSALTDTQYAQINANGTIGTWRTSSTLNTGVWAAGTVTYNGYLYVVAGRISNTNTTTAVQYATIDRAGRPVAFGTLTNNFGTARSNICSVAYNGYLYAIGGSTTDSGSQNVTTVQYTTLNSSTGNNGSWSSATVLPTARGSAGCTAHNGYLYVLAGYTGTGSGSQSNAVLYITISSNGSLGGSWTASGNSLPASLGGRPAVFTYGTSAGMYIYVLGGCVTDNGLDCSRTRYASLNASTGAVGTWTVSGNDMSSLYGYRAYAQVGKYLYAFGGGTTSANSSVEYTSINNNGSINAWTSTASMNTAIQFTSGVTVNGCIYQVGGEASGSATNIVQYACPAANGAISAWYSAPNLTVATTDMGVTSYNSYIYGVGGYTTSVQTTTQYSYVNHGGNGSTGSWSTTTSTSSSHSLTKAVAYNGYIYLVNGKSNANSITATEYAPINADGTLGSWTTTSDPQTVRAYVQVLAYNGYMYAVGGTGSTGSSPYNTVEYAPINSNGSLGTWQSTTNLATGVMSAASAAYNGYIYLMGGWDGSGVRSDVQYAAINSNGTVGTWSTTTSFTTARASNSGFTANGYLYVLGGDNNSGTYYNDVQYAAINSNGTVGTWNYTTSFATPRTAASVAVSNGFVYLMGGTVDVQNGLSNVQYATLNSGGTLGPWQAAASLGTGVYNAANTAYNGYLYMASGLYFSGSTQYSTGVQYASLNSISRTARYSKLIDLGVSTNVSSITYNGTLPTSLVTPGVAPISFRAAGSDGVFGLVTSSSAITPGATGCLAGNQNYKRYLLVTMILDDTSSALLADAAGTLSNVTDFTVNYTPVHPPPNIRLRHGQTLQLGNLSPLDTCTP